jgi:hypothetical protein
MDVKRLLGELDEEEEEMTAVTRIITAEYFSRMWVKCKAIPLQAWTGPEGSRRLRLP